MSIWYMLHHTLLFSGNKTKLLLLMAATLILQHSTAAADWAVGAGNSSLAKPGCRDKCGNVSIPYPFGIGKDCFREGFEVYCPPDDVPILNTSGTPLLEINLNFSEARIQNNISQAWISPSSMTCLSVHQFQFNVSSWFLEPGTYSQQLVVPLSHSSRGIWRHPSGRMEGLISTQSVHVGHSAQRMPSIILVRIVLAEAVVRLQFQET